LISAGDDAIVVVVNERSGQMIDGLKLTLTGEDLRRLLEERAAAHRASAARWDHERERTLEDQTEDAPLLPDHMCENEAERQVWRADVLEFHRDHLEPLEIYRLGESDLAFAELLPPKPGWLEQDEYEERTRIGFGLERVAKRVCAFPEIIEITNPDSR
jgi:hypothetical protein